MGLFGRRRGDGEGLRLELEGELEKAVGAYQGAGLGDDAARVLGVLADLEGDARARLRLIARARSVALEGGALRQVMALRYARLRLDLARAAGGATLPSELVSIAEELSAAGDAMAAAAAYRLAGDHAGEARVLVEHGEVEAVESTLSQENAVARTARTLAGALADVEALELSGQREKALGLARRLDGAEAEHAAQRLEARLVRPPTIRMETPDMTARWVMGASLVLGRSEADVVVGSPLISRRHLRFARALDGSPTVEDLGAANGTLLGGARLAAGVVLRVSAPLSLRLGSEVPCEVAPFQGGLLVHVGAEPLVLPLGPATVGAFTLQMTARAFRLGRAPGGPVPVLGRAAVGEGVDLSMGDEIREARDGAVQIRVLG